MGIARLNVNLLPMYQVYNAKRKNSRIHICVLLPTTLLKDRSFLQIKCCTRQDKIMSFQIKIFELVKSRKLLIYPFLFWSGFSKTALKKKNYAWNKVWYYISTQLGHCRDCFTKFTQKSKGLWIFQRFKLLSKTNIKALKNNINPSERVLAYILLASLKTNIHTKEWRRRTVFSVRGPSCRHRLPSLSAVYFPHQKNNSITRSPIRFPCP